MFSQLISLNLNFDFLQEHRTSQLPLDLDTVEDDAASMKSDNDSKSKPIVTQISSFSLLLNDELLLSIVLLQLLKQTVRMQMVLNENQRKVKRLDARSSSLKSQVWKKL